eukprot:6279270-Prymnesium_polylepis.1
MLLTAAAAAAAVAAAALPHSLPRVLRDGLAPARATDRAGTLRLDSPRRPHRPPCAARRAPATEVEAFVYETDVLHVVLLAACAARVRDDAAAHAEPRAHRSLALISPPPCPAAQPLTCCSILLTLSLWLGA